MKEHSPKKPKTDLPALEPMELAQLAACIDYLHAFVVDGEFEAACYYEYGRESRILRDAASELARLRHAERAAERKAATDAKSAGTNPPKAERRFSGEVSRIIAQRYSCDPFPWFAQPHWSFVWQCPSFPDTTWNQLTQRERADIVRVYPTQPLPMQEAAVLDALGIFNKFKALSTQEEDRKVYPIIHEGQFTHVVFTLNCAIPRDPTIDRIKECLDLPEIKARFDEYKDYQRGKTGTAKNALKKLVEARLYRQLGFERGLKFAEDNQRKDVAGNPRPFHDAQKGLNALWSEESSARKALARYSEHLAEFIPLEFPKQSQNTQG